MGSGTTIKAAQKLGRNSIGIEIVKEFYESVKTAANQQELVLTP
jgi:DNA modification methylase